MIANITHYVKSHWEAATAAGGIVGVLTMNKFNAIIAAAIGLATLIFVLCRCFIWILRARIAWRNRNNTRFFMKVDEETET